MKSSGVYFENCSNSAVIGGVFQGIDNAIEINGGENFKIARNLSIDTKHHVFAYNARGISVEDAQHFGMKRLPRDIQRAILKAARKNETAETINSKFGASLKTYGIDLPNAISAWGQTTTVFGPQLVEFFKRLFVG